MPPKRVGVGRKGAKNKPNEEPVNQLPEATREDMLALNRLDDSARWSGISRRGHGPDEVEAADYAPEGAQWDDPDEAARELEERGFLVDGGWHPVSFKEGETRHSGGLTSHRGVLHPEEYVDDDRLIALIEAELGFTYDEIRSVYRQGRKSDSQRELRERIDARLLALSRSGGNLTELGRRLGFPTSMSGDCKVFREALARAREAEGQAA